MISSLFLDVRKKSIVFFKFAFKSGRLSPKLPLRTTPRPRTAGLGWKNSFPMLANDRVCHFGKIVNRKTDDWEN